MDPIQLLAQEEITHRENSTATEFTLFFSFHKLEVKLAKGDRHARD